MGPSPAGVPGFVAGRRGAPSGRSPAAGRHAQHPGGGGGAGAGLPRHQVSAPRPRPAPAPRCPRRPRHQAEDSRPWHPSRRFLLLGEGGRRRACLTAVSCWNQGIINTISLLLLPPPPPPGLANKQAVTGSPGQGGAGPPAAGRAGPAREPRGTRGHARAHGRTRTGTAAGALRSWRTISFVWDPLRAASVGITHSLRRIIGGFCIVRHSSITLVIHGDRRTNTKACVLSPYVRPEKASYPPTLYK